MNNNNQMSNNNLGNSKNSFPQETNVSLIYTFVSDENNVEKIKSEALKKCFEIDNSFISDNSRHFDHIENIFYKKDLVYIFKGKEQECFSRFPLTNSYGNKLDGRYRISDIRLIVFETGIFFIEIKYKLLNVPGPEDYFDYLLDLRNHFKDIEMDAFVKSVIGNELKYESFDMQGNSKTTRFQLFSDIVLGNKQTTLHNDKFLIGENEINIISNYFLNRNSVKHYNIYQPHSINNYSMFLGNNVFCNEEGVLSITQKNSLNKELFERTYEKAIVQNLLYSYLLVLHQYYYLHFLKRRIQYLDIYDKDLRNDLLIIKEKYTIFKTKYLFNKVSLFYYQQKIYELFFNSLSISSFSDEIKDSFDPLDKLLKNSREEKLNLFAKLFTTVTITNATISIFNFIMTMFVKIEWLRKVLILSPAVIVLLSYVLILLLYKTSIKKK